MRKQRKNRSTAKIVLAPNPILTTICDEIKEGEDVSAIIRDMMHVLLDSVNGVGLSANQAGHTKRVILVRLGNLGYVPMINPEFTDFDGNTKMGWERCLSYPGEEKKISRFTCIDVAYIDENGVNQCDTLNGFEARIVQHEVDHLNGKCLVGRFVG